MFIWHTIISQGWLYVFSLFPPPLLPQWLLLLTSQLFELNLRYLGQRKYRSRKMYWMTFWWPWPEVKAVTLINKNLLVCRIKWEPLNQSVHNLVAISLWSCLSPDYILEGFCWKLFFAKLSLKILDVFFKVKHFIGHISGMVDPIDVKWKGGASVGYWVNWHWPLTSPITLTL